MTTKPCRGCGVWFPLEQFRRDSNRPDGRRAQCKDCTSAQDADWRKRHAAELVEKRKVWHRVYRSRYPSHVTARLSKYRQDRPQANRAHNIVNKAISRGTLVRPSKCEWCSAEGRIEATHGDYSKPYEIVWLCTQCHRKRDRAALRGDRHDEGCPCTRCALRGGE